MVQWIAVTVVGIGVAVVALALILFIAQIFYTALPINNSSPFYYQGSFITYFPNVITLVLVAFIGVIAIPLIYMFYRMIAGGAGPGGR